MRAAERMQMGLVERNNKARAGTGSQAQLVQARWAAQPSTFNRLERSSFRLETASQEPKQKGLSKSRTKGHQRSSWPSFCSLSCHGIFYQRS